MCSLNPIKLSSSPEWGWAQIKRSDHNDPGLCVGVENSSDEGFVNDLSLCTRLHRTLQSNTHLILNLVQVKLFPCEPGIPGRSELCPGRAPAAGSGSTAGGRAGEALRAGAAKALPGSSGPRPAVRPVRLAPLRVKRGLASEPLKQGVFFAPSDINSIKSSLSSSLV